MNESNDKKVGSNIPENDPSKAMDSKKEVERSPDPKIDQDFPGYPHYPAKEDVMHQDSGMHRVDEDVESISNSNNASGVNQRFAAEGDNSNSATNDEAGVPQNVSNDDLASGRQQPGTDLDEAQR